MNDKKIEEGIYAVRIKDVHRIFDEDDELFVIDIEVLCDMNNYYYYREEFKIKYVLHESLSDIRKFINTSSPFRLNDEMIYTTPIKRSSAYDMVLGLEVKNGSYIWTDINEYRFNPYTDNDEPKPF
jgi:hypothetical protein